MVETQRLLLLAVVMPLIVLHGHGASAQVLQEPGLLLTSRSYDGESHLMYIPGSGEHIYSDTSAGGTVGVSILLSDAGSIKAGVAVDHEDDLVFWADPAMKAIYAASLVTGNGGAIYRGISDLVEGIAVDWTANKLYWTDASYNWIAVSDYDGENVRTLVHTGLDKPRGIVVDPIRGHLYWCDYGLVGRIEKSNLDGSDRQTIASQDMDNDNVYAPHGLVIDFEESRLYWTDSTLKKIMSVGLDDDVYTVREVLEESTFRLPFDISLDRDYFFVGDFITENVWIIQRANTANRIAIKISTLQQKFRPLGMTCYSAWLQPTAHSPCSNNNGGCQHLCVGDPSGHKCLCKHGFVLASDSSSCVNDTHLVPGHQVLYSTDNSICRLPVDFAHSYVPVTEHCFMSGIHATAMDYHYYQDMLYFHDMSSATIQRAVLRDDPSFESVVTDVTSVSGIGIDWLANNLYWADSERKSIYISKLDGSYKTVLLSENIEEPRGIAVHPVEKLLFWADSGSTPRIEKSALSGRQRAVFVSTSIVAPSALTMDHINNRLYWVNVFGVSDSSTIESIGINGEQRTIDWLAPSEVYGLTVFQDHLYWTESNGIVDFSHVAGEFKDRKHLEHTPSAVLAFDKSKQTLAAGPCDIQNGGCDEICVPSMYGAECLCSETQSQPCAVVARCPVRFMYGETTDGCVNTPGNSCQFTCDDHFEPSTAASLVCQPTGEWDLDTGSLCRLDIRLGNFLLVADTSETGSGTIYHVNLDSPMLDYVPLPLTDILNPVALDYDHVDGKVYWTDVATKTINRAKLDGRDREVIVATNVDVPDGIAIDLVGRKVYWTDTGLDRISRADLDGSNIQSIVHYDLDEPRAITVDSLNSRIYWTDWGTAPKIEQANLDGSGRRTIVSTDLGWPNGLALDSSAEELFWCDAQTDRIEVIHLSTNQRRVLVVLADAHPFGLTLGGDEYIYWTDWSKNQVQRADKDSGYNVIGVGYPVFEKPHGLQAVAMPLTTGEPTTVASKPATATQISAPNTGRGPPTNWTVIGAVVGAVVLLGIALAVICTIFCRRRNTEVPNGSLADHIYCEPDEVVQSSRQSNKHGLELGDGDGRPSAPPAPSPLVTFEPESDYASLRLEPQRNMYSQSAGSGSWCTRQPTTAFQMQGL